MALINRLAALEGLGVNAALRTVLAESSGCHGEEKPGSICWPAVGHSVSSSLLSSCVWKLTHFFFFLAEAPAVILLEDCCRELLRNSIWFQLPCCPFYVYFIIFPQGYCVGRDEYRGQDGGSVVTGGGRRGGWVGGEGILCFVVNFPEVFPVTFSLTVFVAAKCFPRDWMEGWSTAPEDSLLYPLCPASHILKTVRISQSSKSRPCTKVTSLSFEYSNINVIIPPLLIAYCIHLHSGFAKNNRKSTVIVKHIYTHSSLPHLSLYHCNDCCTQHS